ncbi:aspartyl-phosphate phosphatase Spo0E family protein [Ammoniphilus sp. 3BR4]|uniref:aspartyl-phosphate phosphatase Spo0E family protein n=1 Tax=Ammoniphilus sp. 3BR4 TaxID=3158265 RepID=UPI003466BF99
MLYYKALVLKREIQEQRKKLNDLVTLKGIGHSDVLRMSQKLDEKVVQLQKLILKNKLRIIQGERLCGESIALDKKYVRFTIVIEFNDRSR